MEQPAPHYSSTMCHALKLMAELIGEHDNRALQLRDESPLTHPFADSDGMAMERLGNWREMLFAIRDDYAARAFNDGLQHSCQSPDDGPITLLTCYDWATQFLDRAGLSLDLAGKHGIAAYRVAQALQTVATWIFAKHSAGKGDQILLAALQTISPPPGDNPTHNEDSADITAPPSGDHQVAPAPTSRQKTHLDT